MPFVQNSPKCRCSPDPGSPRARRRRSIWARPQLETAGQSESSNRERAHRVDGSSQSSGPAHRSVVEFDQPVALCRDPSLQNSTCSGVVSVSVGVRVVSCSVVARAGGERRNKWCDSWLTLHNPRSVADRHRGSATPRTPMVAWLTRDRPVRRGGPQPADLFTTHRTANPVCYPGRVRYVGGAGGADLEPRSLATRGPHGLRRLSRAPASKGPNTW